MGQPSNSKIPGLTWQLAWKFVQTSNQRQRIRSINASAHPPLFSDFEAKAQKFSNVIGDENGEAKQQYSCMHFFG